MSDRLTESSEASEKEPMKHKSSLSQRYAISDLNESSRFKESFLLDQLPEEMLLSENREWGHYEKALSDLPSGSLSTPELSVHSSIVEHLDSDTEYASREDLARATLEAKRKAEFNVEIAEQLGLKDHAEENRAFLRIANKYVPTDPRRIPPLVQVDTVRDRSEPDITVPTQEIVDCIEAPEYVANEFTAVETGDMYAKAGLLREVIEEKKTNVREIHERHRFSPSELLPGDGVSDRFARYHRRLDEIEKEIADYDDSDLVQIVNDYDSPWIIRDPAKNNLMDDSFGRLAGLTAFYGALKINREYDVANRAVEAAYSVENPEAAFGLAAAATAAAAATYLCSVPEEIPEETY